MKWSNAMVMHSFRYSLAISIWLCICPDIRLRYYQSDIFKERSCFAITKSSVILICLVIFWNQYLNGNSLIGFTQIKSENSTCKPRIKKRGARRNQLHTHYSFTLLGRCMNQVWYPAEGLKSSSNSPNNCR